MKRSSRTQGDLHGRGPRTELVRYLGQHAIEVCSLAVHLVDEGEPGHAVPFRLSPDVSVWGSTPPTAQKTATAPSSTLSDRSTSMVKSTWPGVSMMFMIWSLIEQVVAADVMVMPRSSPAHPVHDRQASCTSPIL